MDRGEAEVLVEGLRKRPEFDSLDSGLFTDALESTEVPPSSRFYEETPDVQHTMRDSDRVQFLSVRRVLRNENARNYQLSLLKRGFEAAASALRVYSSDALTRRLRADNDLVKIMAECWHPFSLLGKLQTYDYSNPDSAVITTKPILIIPDAGDIETILRWEDANTTYEKEVKGSLFGYKTKRVNPANL